MIIQIGELFFTTKAQALEYFHAVLYRYEPGDIIGKDDTRELLWLLDRHPDADQKRGGGAIGFSVERLFGGARRFRILRVDGSSIDFSFRKCIDKPPSPLSRISAALRVEVRGAILRAKWDYFDAHGDVYGRVACQLGCGSLVTIDEADADHAPPYTFHVLATTFLGALSLPAEQVLLEPLVDEQWGRRLQDRDLAARWQDFHHRHADLRIVCRGEHQARSQQNRRRKANRQLVLPMDGG
jgi:hypothetical protein